MESQPNDYRVAASNVRAAAARQKLSGREIARRLNVTHAYVARRVSGAVEFSESDLLNFAAVLGVEAASLLEDPRAAVL